MSWHQRSPSYMLLKMKFIIKCKILTLLEGLSRQSSQNPFSNLLLEKPSPDYEALTHHFFLMVSNGDCHKWAEWYDFKCKVHTSLCVSSYLSGAKRGESLIREGQNDTLLSLRFRSIKKGCSLIFQEPFFSFVFQKISCIGNVKFKLLKLIHKSVWLQ